jgi:tRNA-uridine 2-sulfurtransferase
VIVGLSGGVDSSVAAFLLKQEGYEVTGVTMSLWDGNPAVKSTGKHSCYGPDEKQEIEEARELAGMLDIPFHVFDCSQRYKTLVLDYFRQEYLSGRTPNPCVKCNELIKFGMLPEMARLNGIQFDYFATGHYARVSLNEQHQRYLLKRGVDLKKDQTYFIYRLSQEQLSTLLLPVGNLTKQEVRAIASKIHISLTEKDESQDFYSGDYKELLNVEDRQGNIVDRKGNILGKHNGIWNFTIGQRKGLGVAFTEPLYVIELNPGSNEVVVGTRHEIMGSTFMVTDLNWIAFQDLHEPIEVQAKIRSAQKESDAIVEPAGEGMVKVTFHLPNDGISPGQSAVFYQEDIVLGGGVIKIVESQKLKVETKME